MLVPVKWIFGTILTLRVVLGILPNGIRGMHIRRPLVYAARDMRSMQVLVVLIVPDIATATTTMLQLLLLLLLLLLLIHFEFEVFRCRTLFMWIY
jgi:hypothetical protein